MGRAANHYDFCGIIMIFCLLLRHYTRTLKYYDKSSIFLVIISLTRELQLKDACAFHGRYELQASFSCCSVVRAFAHGAMGRRIDPSWGGPYELFLVPASAPRLV